MEINLTFAQRTILPGCPQKGPRGRMACCPFFVKSVSLSSERVPCEMVCLCLCSLSPGDAEGMNVCLCAVCTLVYSEFRVYTGYRPPNYQNETTSCGDPISMASI